VVEPVHEGDHVVVPQFRVGRPRVKLSQTLWQFVPAQLAESGSGLGECHLAENERLGHFLLLPST
jgi:hypothetical protein